MPARFWILQNKIVTPCTSDVWKTSRKDARNFLMAKHHIEPGFIIQTQFIGLQAEDRPPILFKTSVFSDMGESVRFTPTYDEAVRMHMMECQRIAHLVGASIWDDLEDLVDLPDFR